MRVPTLSAIIPTRNRPEMLADALRSLMVQTITDFEVVVIDDGSEPSLEPVVAGVRGPVPIRYHRQAPAGLNVGRNTAADVATGDILAYLDDDVIVAPGWAGAMRAAFDGTVAAVAGRIQLWLEGPAPAWLTPRLRTFLSELDLGAEPQLLTDHLPYGANCAVTRDWFERVGGFAAGLDRIGASLVSNGDIEFFRRVQSAGGTIAYRPAAAVLHRVPAERLTPGYFRRRARAQGVSDVLLTAADSGGRTTKTARLLREGVRGARALPVLAKGVATGTGVRNAGYWLDYTRGRVAAIRGGS